MEWSEYYGKFDAWATATQISRLSALTSYGPSAEVAEVAQGLMDETAASRLIRRALAAGVQFTAEEICELADCCNAAVMNALLENASCTFTREQLEDLYGCVDDAVLERAARRCCVKLFEEEEEEEDEEEEEEEDEDEDFEAELPPPVRRREPKPGFCALLGAALLGTLSDDGHGGRCTGDCAHCPPHFGYRYGRWYYGHGHVYGCEFGGNRGDGYD